MVTEYAIQTFELAFSLVQPYLEIMLGVVVVVIAFRWLLGIFARD